MRDKQIDEANLINAAKEAAKEEISLLSPRRKGTPLDFEVGIKAKPAYPAAVAALKRHDSLIASAHKLYDKTAVTALKQHLKDLDAALLKPVIGGNLENASGVWGGSQFFS